MNEDVFKQLCHLANKTLIGYITLLNKNYIVADHNIKITKALEKIVHGEINRLIIEAPPRHGKSMLVSQYFPAWFLGKNPDKEVIFATYGDALVQDCGRAVRNIILNPLHKAVFRNSEIAADSRARDEFKLTEGGAYHGTSVGGSVTGRGGACLILDDVLKGREQAASEIYRERLHSWYETDLYTRGTPNPKEAAIVIMGTRWHIDDLTGYVLKNHSDENWVRLKLPAISPDGSALWPERMDMAAIENTRKVIGELNFQSLYMQEPIIPSGNIVQRSWFKYHDGLDPHKNYQWTQSWDLSVKEGKDNSYTVGQVWAKHGANNFLVHQYRKQIGFVEAVKAMRMMKEMYPQTHRILVEDKANGPAVIATLNNEIGGIIPIEPKGSKQARLENCAFIIESGNVYLPTPNKIENAWVKDYIYEVTAFPLGEFDDQCLVAGTKIATLFGDKNIEHIKKNDYVITPLGIRKVLNAFSNGTKPIIKKNNLIGTSNHPIFIYENGFVKMDSLTQYLKQDNLSLKGILKWKYKNLLHSMESNTNCSGKENIILVSQKTIKNEKILKDFMLQFGNFILEKKYKKALSFTIKIAILSIMTTAIWSVYQFSNIAGNILSFLQKNKNNTSKKLGLLQQNGTDQKKEDNGIVTIQKKHTKIKKLIFSFVNFVEKRLKRNITNQVIVQRFADINKEQNRDCMTLSKNVLFVGKNSKQQNQLTQIMCQKHVEENAEDFSIGKIGLAKVYNLTIDKDHVYYANGTLVGNCDVTSQYLNYENVTVIDKYRKLCGGRIV